MKIEKVNDHQIRCTLTREDLASRGIHISELAYGSDKARDLFSEMLKEAYDKFGFDTEDAPLMIEAIPMNTECLVLVISKVEDPEELDTRFSHFTPSLDVGGGRDSNEYDEDEDFDEGEDHEHDHDEPEEPDDSDFLQLFRQLQGGLLDPGTMGNGKPVGGKGSPQSGKGPSKLKQRAGLVRPRGGHGSGSARLFSFRSMHEFMQLQGVIPNQIQVRSTLYRDLSKNCYLLLVQADSKAAANFSAICTILSEYSKEEAMMNPRFLEEHCKVVIQGKALQSLISK